MDITQVEESNLVPQSAKLPRLLVSGMLHLDAFVLARPPYRFSVHLYLLLTSIPSFPSGLQDLDGTLLCNDGTVSPRNTAALRLAQDHGIEVMLASGRSPRSIHKVISMLGGVIPDMTICCNGGMVYNPRGRRVVMRNEMSIEDARTCIEVVRGAISGVGFAFEVATEDGTSFKCDEVYLKVRREYMYYDYQLFEDPIHMLNGEEGVTKILALHPSLNSTELFARVPVELVNQDVSPVIVTYSNSFQLEISGRDVSKGSILAQYCEERGIAAEEVIAFGDMLNDIEMMRWVGTAIAMGNAHEEILGLAQRTTLSNEKDGVAIEIEKILEAASLSS
ncbi:HAD-like domain-containing protein [Endogone sp. FLAS-F59071]|nr:HAD-like domain-containing protein [Endogone sp. FLAS-F59071]|eukprot:RUS20772.1 HAD-like domain-containing protein [Endogone sp. FLAS-F59071]